MEWFAIPGAVACYRTCALYKGDRRIVAGIVGCYFASILCSAFVVGFAVKHASGTFWGRSLVCYSFQKFIYRFASILASATVDPGDTLKVCHGIIPAKGLYAAL